MTEKFEQWAVVELFGHSRIAGKVSEQVIGGCSFVRVDVPAVNGNQSFTKLYGQGAIYAMTFVDEETATGAAEQLREKPIDEWSARRMMEEIQNQEQAKIALRELHEESEHPYAENIDDDDIPFD